MPRNLAVSAHDRQLEYLISITSRCRAVSTDRSMLGKSFNGRDPLGPHLGVVVGQKAT